jgi:hypothetical protein
MEKRHYSLYTHDGRNIDKEIDEYIRRPRINLTKHKFQKWNEEHDWWDLEARKK